MDYKIHSKNLPNDKFFTVNQNGNMEFNKCDVVELAKEYGTPLYVVNEDGIREKCQIVKKGFMNKYDNTLALYASKAFSCTEIYRILKEEGLGVDVVSGGELYTAYKAGFPMDKVYFHGNNKSAAELELALDYKVGRLVVDSYHELEVLNEIAKKRGVKQEILLRISPGIDIHSHEYLKTGVLDCKFGFPIETGFAHDVCLKASQYENLELVGIHCHIGSQILLTDSFTDAILVMANFIKEIKDKYGICLKELNVGGGYGVRFTDDSEFLDVCSLWELMMNALYKFCDENSLDIPKVLIEPGRWIISESGITLYKTGTEKDIKGVRKYISVDGGMADNPRVTLYGAKYQALCANKMNEQETQLVSIAGRCCETGDILIKDIVMPDLEPNDVLAVLSTGAYNYAMSSNYNRLPRPAVVMIKDGKPRIIVKRETYEDIIRNDV